MFEVCFCFCFSGFVNYSVQSRKKADILKLYMLFLVIQVDSHFIEMRKDAIKIQHFSSI